VNQGKVKSKRRSTKSSEGKNTPSHYGTRIAKGVTPVKHYRLDFENVFVCLFISYFYFM
jgi:hypothetical protein